MQDSSVISPADQAIIDQHFPVLPHDYQAAHFRHHWPELHRVAQYLQSRHAHLRHPDDDTKMHPLAKLGYKLASCLATPTIQVSADGDQMIIAQGKCKSRLCPLCGRARARRLMHRLSAIVKAMDAPRRITLTIAHSDRPLRDQILHLTTSFHAVRRTLDWKKHVVGGVYVIEITWNTDRQQWHPHIHAIIDGTYLPHAKLKAAWHAATADSWIVDIRRCDSERAAVRYLTDYLTKSQDASKIADHLLPEWATQLHGMRLAQTFGKSHGIRPDDEFEYVSRGYRTITGLNALFSEARRGDAEAVVLYQSVQSLVHRSAPDTPDYDPELAKTRITEVTNQLRTWNDNRQNLGDCDDADQTPDPTRRPCPDQRTFWDRQDHNPEPPH